MTKPSTLLRLLASVLLTGLPALAQTVTGTVTAATQLRVSAGNPPANTNTRPAGTNLTGGLNLGTSWTFTPLFVSVNSAFGYSATASSITHTISESMSGFNAPVSAGPHATLLRLTASQPVTGTLIVQYTPGASGGGASSTAAIDIGDDGSVEWTRAAGTSLQTFQRQVTVNGSLDILVSTAMVSTSHSLSVQFTNWLPFLPLVDNGFESGLTGWQTFGNVFAPPASPPAVAPRTGVGLCKMFGAFAGSLNSGAFQRFAANPGETYALDGYARHWSGDPLTGSAPSGNRAVKKIVFLDVGGNEIGSNEGLALDGSMATDAWQHTPAVFATAPPGTVAVQPMLLFVQPGVAGGSAQFDDVSFALASGCGPFVLPVGSAAGTEHHAGAAFTLDVTATHGVGICSIDVMCWAAAGTTLNGTVYLHRSLTDIAQLTAAQSGADNWCAIGTLVGVARGPGVATSCAVQNATNAVLLPPGQYLLAAHMELNCQFAAATSLSVGDAGNNLTLRTGLSLDLGLPFAQIAGHIPGALHFEVLSAPPILSPCVAEAFAVGAPCGGVPNAVYEVFPNALHLPDLGDLLVSGNGTGASLSNVSGTPMVPPASAPIALPGGVSAPIPLGFHLGTFGLPNVTDIRICDQGSIFFGGVGSTASNPTPAMLSNDPVASLAAYWSRYTSGSSSIYVDVTAGVQAVVTFDMYEYDNDLYYYFQVVITPTAMRVRFAPLFPAGGLVGFHNGIPLLAPPRVGEVDISAGPSPFTSPNATADLILVANNRPLLGANFDFRLEGNPIAALVMIDIAPAGPGVPLPTPLFAPACNLYIGLNPALTLTLFGSSVTSVPVPQDTALLGVEFAMQGGTVRADGRIIASNGIAAKVSNW